MGMRAQDQAVGDSRERQGAPRGSDERGVDCGLQHPHLCFPAYLSGRVEETQGGELIRWTSECKWEGPGKCVSPILRCWRL